jgi:hypothetical protein
MLKDETGIQLPNIGQGPPDIMANQATFRSLYQIAYLFVEYRVRKYILAVSKQYDYLGELKMT